MKKSISILAALFLIFNVFAQNDPSYDELSGGLNTITTAVPFLMISPDSRSGAMGDIGVATTPDANSSQADRLQDMLTMLDVASTTSFVNFGVLFVLLLTKIY